MACGADWDGFSQEYDTMVIEHEFARDQWYNGDSEGFAEFCRESDITKDHIQGEALTSGQAATK